MRIPGLLSIIALFIHMNAHAQTETKRAHDVNKDGIQDRFEFSVSNKVVRIEEDRNGDKRIDFKVILDDKIFYKIEFQDTDSDGSFDRKVSYLLQSDSKIKIQTEVDKNKDGVFEIKYFSKTTSDQKMHNLCFSGMDKQLEGLSNSTLKAVAQTENGLLPTGLGFKVDHACYDKWGLDFNKVIKEVVQVGLQCLNNLHEKGNFGSKSSGALRNAFGYADLTSQDNVSLVCSEDTGFNWSGIRAHASTSPSVNLRSKSIKHPFVSLNPELPSDDEPLETQLLKIKKTIFHENLHNLGYLHEEDIEYSYTCGTCCFGEEKDDKAKNAACKVCTGDYTNNTDFKYIKDVVEFTRATYDDERGTTAVKKYLKENLKDNLGLSILAYTNSGIFNPIGPELNNLIMSKGLVVSDEAKAYLIKSTKYQGIGYHQNAKTSAKHLSEALYELYYNKDGSAAVSALSVNKLAIKTELKKLKSSQDKYDTYVAMSLEKSLNNIIDEMWLDDYPDEDTSFKAYQLYTFFKDEK